MTNAQQAFDEVKNLLVNFKADIVTEQSQADIRNEKDEQNCDDQIAAAQAKVASRQADVDDLQKHIDWLNNEQTESETDQHTREDRIVANAKLLADFKQQRCDNNLLFVKQLREHMEAIDVLGYLRGDIVDYFNNKNSTQGVNTAFIERFAEFSHLLSDKHKQIFMQLTQVVQGLPDVNALTSEVDASTATQERTADQVGTGHVDNTQGPLQKLDHVAWESTDAYNAKLEQRVLDMIDGLIQHLKDSRDDLTKNEIQAAEDFAVFQTNMEKENTYLQNKIAELIKHINDLVNQLNVATVQLGKREKLLQDAENELAQDQKVCQEKEDYYQAETARRTGELQTVDEAGRIFDNILSNLSQRVKERADALAAGADTTGSDLSANVVNDQNPISTGVSDRVNGRNQVVF
jgi:chromosome segregation ATPase